MRKKTSGAVLTLLIGRRVFTAHTNKTSGGAGLFWLALSARPGDADGLLTRDWAFMLG